MSDNSKESKMLAAVSSGKDDLLKTQRQYGVLNLCKSADGRRLFQYGLMNVCKGDITQAVSQFGIVNVDMSEVAPTSDERNVHHDSENESEVEQSATEQQDEETSRQLKFAGNAALAISAEKLFEKLLSAFRKRK
uniref:Uncharacterized protein n=1 Tax=Plectus sambesii TaxID=2011161 RepID=A0A914WIJ2_9BILA